MVIFSLKCTLDLEEHHPEDQIFRSSVIKLKVITEKSEKYCAHNMRG